jgi:hypothetical protein
MCGWHSDPMRCVVMANEIVERERRSFVRSGGVCDIVMYHLED